LKQLLAKKDTPIKVISLQSNPPVVYSLVKDNLQETKEDIYQELMNAIYAE
jgi:hypothetical protein